MSSKRLGKLAAASLLGIALLGVAACSNPGGGEATSGDSGGTIEVWDYLGQGVSDTAMKAVVAAFEDKHPDIKVNRTSFAFADLSKSIVQGGVGGQVPDVAIVDVVDNQNFAALGLLQDVTDLPAAQEGDFFPGPWSSTQLDGKTYGLPLNSNNLALYYNKEILDAAGVSAPTNWDELREVAKQVTTPEHYGIAMSAIKNEQGTFQFLPFLWQTGGDLDTYATDGATALGFLKDLVDDGSMSKAVSNYSQEDARTQFVTGKAAMMINGPWELQNLADSGIDFGVAPLPKDEVAATGLGGENVVTFAQAKNQAGADAFLEFITSAEGATIYCNESGQLSARPDLSGTLVAAEDPNLQVFEKQLDVARARAYGGSYAEISAAVQISLQKVLTGAASPQDAAEEAATVIDAKLG